MVTDRITISNYEASMFLADRTEIVIPATLMPAFQQLIARGINTWDQAPQEVKDFVDELSGNTKLLGKFPVKEVPTIAPNEFRLVRNCSENMQGKACSYPFCSCHK